MPNTFHTALKRRDLQAIKILALGEDGENIP